MPIQQELIAAAKHDDDFWVTTEYGDNSDEVWMPFPFIATCLVMGASFNINGYFHGVQFEPFTMAYDEGSNNNGNGFGHPIPCCILILLKLN